MQFNEDGSRLATGTVLRNDDLKQIQIKIWNTSNSRLLNTILTYLYIDRIIFFKNDGIPMIGVCGYESRAINAIHLLLYQLKPDGSAECIQNGSMDNYHWKICDMSKWLTNTTEGNDLLLTKKKCRYLYLCLKTIENALNQQTLNALKTNFVYSQLLTEYERDIINKTMAERLSQISSLPIVMWWINK